MAMFDRINGQFVATRCTLAEKGLFQLAGWAVDPKLRRWATTEPERAIPLLAHAVGAAKDYIENAIAIRDAAMRASWAETTDKQYPAPEGKAYMDFQRAGIEYALTRTRTLIADAPGLGKTIQAIGVHNATATKRILIVCPASLKVNWAREWRKWDVHGHTVGIAMSVLHSDPVFEEDGSRARNPDTGALIYNNWTDHDWPATDVVIVNYDMLLTFDKHIKAREWDLAVFDEAHMLKTATTIRTMCVFGGKKAAIKKDGKTVAKAIPLAPVRAKRHLYLTGTPILSKPVELWTLLQACDPRGLGKNWMDFVYEFCAAYDDEFGMKYDGASNLDKLNRLLRERFMVRRDKKSVLKDLPPKTRELILLPADKLEKPIKKEKSRIEKAFAAFEGMMGLDSETDFRFIAQIDGLMDRIGSALSKQDGEEPDWNAAIRTLSEPDQIAFTELSEAREEVALAKVGLVTEHVKNLVDCGEPVILFAYHKSVIAELEKRLTKLGFRVGIVTGSVPPNKRQAVVDAFQNGDLDIIIGNILAMGVGFTLTRASFVVFAELDWVPAMIEQAEDRAWRHGQKNAVTIQHLVVDGSIEAHMITIILEKMLVIFDALDAILP